MAFNPEQFFEAVQRGVGEAFAAEVRKAYAEAGFAAETLTEDRAGELVAVAMASAPNRQARAEIELPFHSAAIEVLTPPIVLSAEEACEHPLLAGWVNLRFAEAVGDAIRGGRLMTNLAPGGPRFDRYHVVEQDGHVVHAVVDLVFVTRHGDVPVSVRYGAMATGGLVRSNGLSGDDLYAIGSGLRNGADVHGQDGELDPASTVSAAAAWPPESGAVH